MIEINTDNLVQTDVRLLELVKATGLISSYSEKSEHLEQKRELIDNKNAISTLISNSVSIHEEMTKKGKLFDDYVDHMQKLETDSLVYSTGMASFVFDVNPEQISSWGILQMFQKRHDIVYHPDVVSEGPRKHLEHTVKHFGSTQEKLIRSFEEGDRDNYAKAALYMVQFSVKAATCLNYVLPEHRESVMSEHEITYAPQEAV